MGCCERPGARPRPGAGGQLQLGALRTLQQPQASDVEDFRGKE